MADANYIKIPRGLLLDAVDAVNLNHSNMEGMEALFTAITRAADKPASSDEIKHLAGIGQYLADQWGYLANEERAKVNELWEEYREAKA